MQILSSLPHLPVKAQKSFLKLLCPISPSEVTDQPPHPLLDQLAHIADTFFSEKNKIEDNPGEKKDPFQKHFCDLIRCSSSQEQCEKCSMPLLMKKGKIERFKRLRDKHMAKHEKFEKTESETFWYSFPKSEDGSSYICPVCAIPSDYYTLQVHMVQLHSSLELTDWGYSKSFMQFVVARIEKVFQSGAAYAQQMEMQQNQYDEGSMNPAPVNGFEVKNELDSSISQVGQAGGGYQDLMLRQSANDEEIIVEQNEDGDPETMRKQQEILSWNQQSLPKMPQAFKQEDSSGLSELEKLGRSAEGVPIYVLNTFQDIVGFNHHFRSYFEAILADYFKPFTGINYDRHFLMNIKVQSPDERCEICSMPLLKDSTLKFCDPKACKPKYDYNGRRQQHIKQHEKYEEIFSNIEMQKQKSNYNFWYMYPRLQKKHPHFISLNLSEEKQYALRGSSEVYICPMCGDLFKDDYMIIQQHIVMNHDDVVIEKWGYNKMFISYIISRLEKQRGIQRPKILSNGNMTLMSGQIDFRNNIAFDQSSIGVKSEVLIQPTRFIKNEPLPYKIDYQAFPGPPMGLSPNMMDPPMFEMDFDLQMQLMLQQQQNRQIVSDNESQQNQLKQELDEIKGNIQSDLYQMRHHLDNGVLNPEIIQNTIEQENLHHLAILQQQDVQDVMEKTLE